MTPNSKKPNDKDIFEQGEELIRERDLSGGYASVGAILGVFIIWGVMDFDFFDYYYYGTKNYQTKLNILIFILNIGIPAMIGAFIGQIVAGLVHSEDNKDG